MAAAALAQTPKEKYMTPGTGGSPPMQTSARLGDREVWIVYHAPSVKGRKIFGGPDALQKPGSVWRMGADQATFLHTDADLTINGVAVPRGEYTLFADLDGGRWKLIVSKETGQWGIKRSGEANFNEAQVLTRIPLNMSNLRTPQEQLKINLVPAGRDKAKLLIAWEHVQASANVAAAKEPRRGKR
jgi:hypothetical protein